MQILHLNHSDCQGGAARAAYRVHRCLVDADIDSRMRVLLKGSADDNVMAGPPRSIQQRIGDIFFRRWLAHTRRNWRTDNPILHTFGQISAGLADELNSCDADILNLHWVSGMLSIADIGRLKKPIVWTLHDMWAFCGGEHYAPDDATARFRLGYRSNNQPAGESGPDLNRRTWEAKRRAWARQQFTIVSPSHWLADCARQSVLFGEATIHVIPNSLDTHYPWVPTPREMARTALNLPLNRKLILSGAHGGIADPRKGSDLLHEGIARIIADRKNTDIELVVFGQSAPDGNHNCPCPVHWLGTVNDDRLLALMYSAADVMVVPSRQDNLPNTAVEAQACGTPVVAFNLGGLPDIVTHQETGWLARPFDTEDLAAGIAWVVADSVRSTALATQSRMQAVKQFSPKVIAQQYEKVYRTMPHQIL